MALLDIRQRTGYLFLAVMLGHVILISAQVNTRRGVPLLQVVTFGLFAEVQRVELGDRVVACAAGGPTTSACATSGRRTKRSGSSSPTRSCSCRNSARWPTAAGGCSRRLDLRDRSNLKTIAAEVIGAGASTDFKTVTIDKGTSDGVAPRHGGDGARRGGRPRRRAERAGRQGAAPDRSERRGGRADRAIAVARRGRRHGRRAAADGVRVGGRRRRRRRHRS